MDVTHQQFFSTSFVVAERRYVLRCCEALKYLYVTKRLWRNCCIQLELNQKTSYIYFSVNYSQKPFHCFRSLVTQRRSWKWGFGSLQLTLSTGGWFQRPLNHSTAGLGKEVKAHAAPNSLVTWLTEIYRAPFQVSCPLGVTINGSVFLFSRKPLDIWCGCVWGVSVYV